RKKLVSVTGDGWQKCVDIFTYERAKDKAAREAARAAAEAERVKGIQRQHDNVSSLLVAAQAAETQCAEDKAELIREALSYYQSEYSEATPRAFFAAELEAMIEKFQVKTELVDRVIEACQSYFSWQYDTVEAAQKAASEVLSLPTGTPSLPFKLRLMEPLVM
ncbi:hypothetical protein, partial [Herbiconiux daphne]